MSALWLHLRASTARWGFLPLTALGVAVLFGRSRFWIGIWPETGAAAQVSAFFLGIFAAGFAAWIAATVEVRGLHEQAAAAAIRPLTIELTRFTATLAWLLAPYLVVAAIAFVITARAGLPPGVGAFLGYVVLGAVTVVFATAWGWLAGRLLAPLIAAVCAALSWFVVLSVLGDAGQLTVVSGPPWHEVRTGTIGLRLAAVVALAVAVSAIGWRAGRRAAFHRRIGAAVAALVGVIALHLATTVVTHRPPVAKPLCVHGAIEYCLWPEHAKYVPLIQALDRRVAALPLPLPLPERVVDYSLSGSQRWIDLYSSVELPGTFDPEFDISEGSRWGLARGVAAAIVKTVAAGCDPTKPDPAHRWDQLFAWLEWRLAGGGKPDYRTDAPQGLQTAWATGHRIAAEQSEHQQAAWAATLIAETKRRHCRAA